MNNADKAKIYDDCIRESDRLQREISKIKSEHTANIPVDKQRTIDENNHKIAFLVKKLEGLFKD